MEEPKMWACHGPCEARQASGTRWQTQWRLPIQVDRGEEMSVVTLPEMAWMKLAMSEVSAELDMIATARVDNQWTVPTALLSEIAEPTTLPTAESVVIWRPAQIVEWHLRGEPEMDRFLTDWIANSGVEIPKATAAVMWASMNNHMVHWLVNRRRPVHLGCGVIVPLQMRRNWKEIMVGLWAAKMSECESPMDRITMYCPKVEEADLLTKWLQSWDNKDKVCEWTFEFEPATSVRTASSASEKAKRVRLKKKGYLASVARMLISRIDWVRRILRSYCNDHANSVVEFPTFECDDTGAVGEVVSNDGGKVSMGRKAIFVPHSIRLQEEPGEPVGPAEADGGVPEVPPVQGGDSAVRDAGPDVVQPGDAEG